MMSKNFKIENIKNLVKKFLIEGDVELAKPFGNGHINDTFLITNSDKTCPDYLLQRINHHIFKDVEAVVVNISRVSNHLEAKLKGDFKTFNSVEQVLILIPTTTGVLFYKDADGDGLGYYHCFEYAEGGRPRNEPAEFSGDCGLSGC